MSVSIVSAGLAAGNTVPVLLFIGFVAAIFAGFIYYVSKMVLGKPETPVAGGEADRTALVLLGVLTAALLLLGVYIPDLLHQWIQSAANVLRG